jgi:hypothetical protein
MSVTALLGWLASSTSSSLLFAVQRELSDIMQQTMRPLAELSVIADQLPALLAAEDVDGRSRGGCDRQTSGRTEGWTK